MPRAIYDVRTRENVSVACEWDIKWLLYIHTIHANASTIQLNASSGDNDNCHITVKRNSHLQGQWDGSELLFLCEVVSPNAHKNKRHWWEIEI